jgi:hypothetical protein
MECVKNYVEKIINIQNQEGSERDAKEKEKEREAKEREKLLCDVNDPTEKLFPNICCSIFKLNSNYIKAR